MRPRRSRVFGIRGQLLAIAAAPFLVMMLIVLGIIYRGSIVDGKAALDRQGRLVARQLAANLEYGLTTFDADQIRAAVAATAGPAREQLGLPVGKILVVDDSGKAVHAESFGGSPHKPSWLAGLLTHALIDTEWKVFSAPIYLDPLNVVTPQHETSRLLGTVRMDVALIPYWGRQVDRLGIDLLLVLGAGATAIALAYALGKRISGVIEQAAATITRIEEGDYSARIEQPGGGELGTLQAGVNLLGQTIGAAQRQLEKELAAVRADYERTLDALQVEREKAEEANAAKSRFLAAVSHDLRTPLYSLQGLAEEQLKAPSSPEDEQRAQKMLDSGQRLLTIIDEILDFIQLENNGYHPAQSRFAPLDELEQIIESLRIPARKKGLYFDLVCSDDMFRSAVGDARAFSAIAANIITNAVTFTDSGGVVVRVACGATERPSGDALVLTLRVEDTGCGLTAEQLERVFRPFEQVNDGLDRRNEGRGLGLAIVKSYCDRLGAEIDVESEPGSGSAFSVTMPFQQDGDAAPDSNDFSGLRALVVGERRSFRDSMGSKLRMLGISVEMVSMSVRSMKDFIEPDEPFDMAFVSDFFPTDDEMSALSSVWATHVVHVYTRMDGDRSFDGVWSLWCGSSRASVARLLRRLQGDRSTTASTEPAVQAKTTVDLPGEYRLLVVEDYAMNREVMRSQLSDNGLTVLEAADADTAIALARTDPVDLILMDIQMPGKDGLTAIKEIRRSEKGTRTPIIGFTASVDKPTHARIIEAGADSVLPKPIFEADLLQAVRAALTASEPC